MRRAHCLTLGLATVALATGLAGASMAQTAPTSAPPRYLNWAGRSEATPAPVAVSGQPATNQRRPNRVIPHGGAAPAPAPAPTAPRRTLTPANAWLRPAAAPVPTAAPPAPAPVAPAAPRPVAPPPARTLPDFLPEQGGRGQPVPADVALAASQPPAPVAPAAAADPMAPRRDAPIFRMQQPAPAAQPTSAEPEQAARRYSVHRLNGQEPDALTMPAPTMVDVATVNLDQTIASQDLAQPAQAPTLIRDAQGRVRAQPAAPEGDYQ